MRALLFLAFLTACPGDPDGTVDTSSVDTDTGDTDTDTGEPDDTGCEATTWFTDSDGDGFGDDATARESCEPTDDEIAVGGDCDDTQSTVHPGAVEICGDGIDNDCNPSANGCRPEGRVDRPDWMSDADSTWSAATDVGLALALGPAGLAVGAPSDSRAITGGGAVAVFTDPTSKLSDPHVLYSSDSAAAAGQSVTWTEDVTGDGVIDLIVGSPARTAGSRSNTGVAWVVPGPVTSNGNLTSEVGLYGSSRKDYAGRAVAAPGDITGDGDADLLVGTPELDGERSGSVYLVEGPVTDDVTLDDSPDRYTSSESVRIGEAIHALEDLDGDGTGELLVGGVDASEGVTRLYVLPPRPVGSDRVEDRAIATVASVGIPNTSTAAAAPGDIDGDGHGDLWVGAPYDGEGRACLFLGPIAGTLSLDAADACLERSDERVGISVAGPGDLDGDGMPDLAATDDQGNVLLIYDVPEGSVRGDARLTGDVSFGSVLASGDANEDGLGDFAVGLQGSFGDQGIAWVFFGSSL